MAFKRYIVRNGKRYGPYLYTSARQKDGKVKTIYVGKVKETFWSKLIDKIGLILGEKYGN